MKQPSKMNLIINWCFILYIAVLFGERLQSIIRCFLVSPDFVFSDFMTGFYNGIVMASLLGSLLLLLILNRDFLKALFKNGEVDYKRLCLTSGVILVAGMIHTEFTILAIQFVAYGFLILALILETVLAQKESKNKGLLWVSLSYLIAFSMAIPVNYISYLDGAPAFHAIQFVVTMIAIGYFVIMCIKVFAQEGEHLFVLLPFLIVLAGDIFLIVFRWSEEMNLFLLIAIAATAVLFVVGKIMELRNKKQEQAE